MLPLVANKIYTPTNGRPMAKPITSHEVTAARAGRPRGSAPFFSSKRICRYTLPDDINVEEDCESTKKEPDSGDACGSGSEALRGVFLGDSA
jgi:hypothetical protein